MRPIKCTKRVFIAYMKIANVLRAAWVSVGIALLLMLIMEFMAFIYVRSTEHRGAHTPGFVPEQDSEVFRDRVWARDYFREFSESGKMRWEPYVYWRRALYEGRYINVDERGVRRTVQQNAGTKASRKIFFYGGSTMWGTGAIDGETIPSHFATFLEDKTRSEIEVINFGESGYVVTQELIHLQLQLLRGNVPEVVVFYDGVNDAWAAYQSGRAGLPSNEANREVEFNLYPRYSALLRRSLREVGLWEYARQRSSLVKVIEASEAKTDANGMLAIKEGGEGGGGMELSISLRKLGDATASHYFSVLQMVDALGKAYNFQTFYFWQPILYTRQGRTKQEELVIASDNKMSSEAIAFHRYVYDAVAQYQNRPVSFHDLSGVFDETGETVYFDYCHVGGGSNLIVAREMFRAMSVGPQAWN